MRHFLLSLILLSFQGTHAEKPLPILLWKTSPEVIDRTAHTVPATNALRYDRLRRYFEAVECRGPDLREQELPKSEKKNLICTMPGDSDQVILLAAHYDLEDKRKDSGAIDDWSGAAMLPMIYKAVHATVPHHTLVFAEFAGEKGARAFVAGLSRKERKSIIAMVGLESLGLGTVQFTGDQNDGEDLLDKEQKLGGLLSTAADIVGGGAKHPEMERVWGSLSVDDTQEFHRIGVPSVLIHSVDWKTRKIAGSEDDRPEAIDTKAYYDAYQLLCTYSSFLDHSINEVFSIQEQLPLSKVIDPRTPAVYIAPPRPQPH